MAFRDVGDEAWQRGEEMGPVNAQKEVGMFLLVLNFASIDRTW